MKNGVPAKKLILGVPLYGHTFTLDNPNNNKIGDPASTPGTAGPLTQEAGKLGYDEICKMIKEGGWKVQYQKDQEAPYAYKGNQWVGYDDPR